MVHLSEFAASLKEAPEISPTMERWLYSTRELERALSKRVIFLCRYSDTIPEQHLRAYADLLLEALRNGDLESEFIRSAHLKRYILSFLERLEGLEGEEGQKKAASIREAIRDKSQNDD